MEEEDDDDEEEEEEVAAAAGEIGPPLPRPRPEVGVPPPRFVSTADSAEQRVRSSESEVSDRLKRSPVISERTEPSLRS